MSVEKHDASSDASAARSAGNGREVKFGRMLESLIEHDGSSRNRKRISRRAGHQRVPPCPSTSTSRTGPASLKLLAIADFFDVSLDYLVYGQPTGSSALPDYGPLYRYIDHALADVQARGSRHTAVVARIGRSAGGPDRRRGEGTGGHAGRRAGRPHPGRRAVAAGEVLRTNAIW